MPDHPARRLSGLLSMDSQRRLPRPWVCGSLELTACARRSSSSTWFSRREGPSAHFRTHVSDGSRFLPDTTGDVFLFLPLLPSPRRQVKGTYWNEPKRPDRASSQKYGILVKEDTKGEKR